jgi:cell division protein FtsL
MRVLPRMEKCLMNLKIAMGCLLIAAAPLAVAQDISSKRPKIESPYKSKGDADKHKGDVKAMGECMARARKLGLKTPDGQRLAAGCQAPKR